MEKLSRWEQETIINFSREDDFAEVYTHEPAYLRKLKILAEQFPDVVQLVGENTQGGKEFILPKNLISLRLPVSEERKQKLRERALERLKR